MYLVKFNIFKLKKLLSEVEHFYNKKIIEPYVLNSEDNYKELEDLKKGFGIIHFYLEN